MINSNKFLVTPKKRVLIVIIVLYWALPIFKKKLNKFK